MFFFGGNPSLFFLGGTRVCFFFLGGEPEFVFFFWEEPEFVFFWGGTRICFFFGGEGVRFFFLGGGGGGLGFGGERGCKNLIVKSKEYRGSIVILCDGMSALFKTHESSTFAAKLKIPVHFTCTLSHAPYVHDCADTPNPSVTH